MGFTRTSYQRSVIQQVNVEETIWKIINKFSMEPAFKKINFEVKAAELEFLTDRDRLEIIIENLVRNAIHFYDCNKVRSMVSISAKIQNDELELIVLDNGVGIGKTHLGCIFNMFYKASTLSGGAGLGLYIVKESLHQLKGGISVESELGFGSMFKIHIPQRVETARNLD